jgi:hypothetical protein
MCSYNQYFLYRISRKKKQKKNSEINMFALTHIELILTTLFYVRSINLMENTFKTRQLQLSISPLGYKIIEVFLLSTKRAFLKVQNGILVFLFTFVGELWWGCSPLNTPCSPLPANSWVMENILKIVVKIFF